jgi:hypothetical protein
MGSRKSGDMAGAVRLVLDQGKTIGAVARELLSLTIIH